MKEPLKIKISPFLHSVVLLAAMTLFSCERKVDTIKKAEILTLPSVTVINFQTVFTDSGKVQLIMAAPVMESFDKTEESPYSEFSSGIEVTFYDGHKDPVATVNAKYAKFTDKKKLWELKDSVVVVNESGNKLETELLYWDQDKDLIYTDRFVKMTSEDQTMLGNGFESDSRLTRRRIKKVTATIYLNDE